MSNQLNSCAIACLLFLSVSGCTAADDNLTNTDTKMIRALVVGSAEHPDPILNKVMELEKQGVVQDVIVRESFPVQIELTGPESVINKLQGMPRKGTVLVK